MSAPQNVYDQVLYPAGTFDQTHPSRLGALGALFGVRPAPVERCRVLDIGCGSGGNLLPMAEALPDSTFVGIDLAGKPIAEGNAWASRLGLRNIKLEQRDLLDFDPEPGSYDYIIAHGFYAWVPAEVRDKLLAAIRKGLSEQGIAYVSYNALPGCYMRMPLRDMMTFHTQTLTDPARKLAQSRAIAAFIAERAPASSGMYKRMMEGQRDRIGKMSNEYLFHDDLAACYEPLYFHQFMAHAARHELRYLAEANYSDMQDQSFPPEVRAVLRGAGDLLAYEQYLDFLVGRSFRRTLLVHERVELNRTLDGSSVRPFFVTGHATPLSKELDLRSDAPERFENASGLVVGFRSPLGKAAMLILHERAPLALSFEELLAAAQERLGADRPASEDPEEQELGELLLAAYGGDMVRLYLARPGMVKVGGERPLARALVRMQAEVGEEVTDLWHRNMKMDEPLARALLRLLDGTRDRAALVADLVQTAEAKAEDLLPGPALEERVTGILEKLGRLALLVG